MYDYHRSAVLSKQQTQRMMEVISNVRNNRISEDDISFSKEILELDITAEQEDACTLDDWVLVQTALLVANGATDHHLIKAVESLSFLEPPYLIEVVDVFHWYVEYYDKQGKITELQLKGLIS